MSKPLVEHEDYYINEQGLYVFTEKHHRERGYCCKNGCLHCPWKFKKKVRKDGELKEEEGKG